MVDEVDDVGKPCVIGTAGGEEYVPIGPHRGKHARVHSGVVPDVIRHAVGHGSQLKPAHWYRYAAIEQFQLNPPGICNLYAVSDRVAQTAARATPRSARRSDSSAARRRVRRQRGCSSTSRVVNANRSATSPRLRACPARRFEIPGSRLVVKREPCQHQQAGARRQGRHQTLAPRHG